MPLPEVGGGRRLASGAIVASAVAMLEQKQSRANPASTEITRSHRRNPSTTVTTTVQQLTKSSVKDSSAKDHQRHSPEADQCSPVRVQGGSTPTDGSRVSKTSFSDDVASFQISQNVSNLTTKGTTDLITAERNVNSDVPNPNQRSLEDDVYEDFVESDDSSENLAEYNNTRQNIKNTSDIDSKDLKTTSGGNDSGKSRSITPAASSRTNKETNSYVSKNSDRNDNDDFKNDVSLKTCFSGEKDESVVNEINKSSQLFHSSDKMFNKGYPSNNGKDSAKNHPNISKYHLNCVPNRFNDQSNSKSDKRKYDNSTVNKHHSVDDKHLEDMGNKSDAYSQDISQFIFQPTNVGIESEMKETASYGQDEEHSKKIQSYQEMFDERTTNENRDIHSYDSAGYSGSAEYQNRTKHYSNGSQQVRPLSDCGDSVPSNGWHAGQTSYTGSDNEETSSTGSCSSDEEDDDEEDTTTSSGQEFVLQDDINARSGGLEPITEEERPATASTADEDESTCCDEDFQWFASLRGQSSPRNPTVNKMSPRSNSPQQNQLEFHQQPIHTTTKPPMNKISVRSRVDSSPRRHNSDKSAPGSLDRRKPHLNRQERDQKSRSSHTLKEHKSPEQNKEFYFPPPPPKYDLTVPVYQQPAHFNYCGNEAMLQSMQSPSGSCQSHWNESAPQQPFCCCNDNCFHKHHERIDPKRYGSSSQLMDYNKTKHGSDLHLGSQPELHTSGNNDHHSMPYGYRYGYYGPERGNFINCCAYHTLPPMPCCRYNMDARNYGSNSWIPFKHQEQDERIRKLESEKESLQLQVSVLSEQIEAQTDKISELEKMLMEKKQMLGNAEDLLQREMLSRSSLETQKLELMSAMSELKLQQAALERENVELRTSHFNNNAVTNHITSASLKKPPMIPRASPIPQHTSTPIHTVTNQIPVNTTSPSPSSISNASLVVSPMRSDNNSNRIEIQQPRTPPASFRRTIDIHYGSLPRQAFSTNGRVDNYSGSPISGSTGTPNTRKGVAFGKGFSLLGGKGRGQSVPNLVEPDKSSDINDGVNSYSPHMSPSYNKNKGIKKIFGKMKRSGSENLDDLPGDGEFKRGGVRATAGARLGWSEQPAEPKKPDKPFHEWTTDEIVEWMQDLGLESYATEAKRWIKNGVHLQSASSHDIEKELGIKNSLHRKKLQLAVLDMTDNGTSDKHLSEAGRLDTPWVLRWLDDTGLPQHKDAFLQARMDGRLLHRLTIDDLTILHVTSLLHATSIKRGIQVLRENSFEPSCLIRRSSPDDLENPEPKQIALWTAHRVMEWLRAVDLAEYAPNLRGAGVHGALMVYDSKFTAELLATLLNIPPSKTLLRRHLSTHFKDLLGKEIIQEKREAETVLGYVPLTPAAKLKIAKKSQFSLKRKKSKGELDYGDLVCPLGAGSNNSNMQSGELTSASNGSAHGDASGMMKKTTVKAGDVCRLSDDPNLIEEVFHSDRNSSSHPKDSVYV